MNVEISKNMVSAGPNNGVLINVIIEIGIPQVTIIGKESKNKNSCVAIVLIQ